jgi:hypothetical protein
MHDGGHQNGKNEESSLGAATAARSLTLKKLKA